MRVAQLGAMKSKQGDEKRQVRGWSSVVCVWYASNVKKVRKNAGEVNAGESGVEWSAGNG